MFCQCVFNILMEIKKVNNSRDKIERSMQKSEEWVATRKEYLMISSLHLMVRWMMCVWWAVRPGSVDATGIGDSINCGADCCYAEPRRLTTGSGKPLLCLAKQFQRSNGTVVTPGKREKYKHREEDDFFIRNHMRMCLKPS